MQLIERDEFLASLQTHFEDISGGEGHCILVSGEAGIGKTALVKSFCKQQSGGCIIYQGACDDLFTPRPLAPLYDVLWQVNKERWPSPPGDESSVLFSHFFQELCAKKEKILLVFEDIHWADEGTLDFIKFFVKRIHQLPCLFILTYRDDEISAKHLLRNILGQLPHDSFSKLMITPLSKQSVVEMATQKGYNGEDVYAITGGNPFYVNEILARYSPGVPDNIKDSILAVYERQKEGTKNAWQIWSVMPEGLEIERVPKIKMSIDINHCFALGVIIVQVGKVVFKHELYRRTIEESLSPLKRIELNKKMLDLFLDDFVAKGEIERILHYAKNAGKKELVVKYAPEAAKKAASIGAHKQASKLYLVAIENFAYDDPGQLTDLWEAYAYECYLSNQIKEAISFTEKVLSAREKERDIKKTCDSLLFLSRLWWFSGDGKKAENFAQEALEILEGQPASSTKAMAYSNMSKLKMLSDEPALCILWGGKALDMAKELDIEEIFCHAMNNVGSARMLMSSSQQKGIAILHQNLEIALQHGFYEDAAQAYTNLGSNLVKIKNYVFSMQMLDDGIRFCNEKDLSSWSNYLLSWKARLLLETGEWTKACSMADAILNIENLPVISKIIALIVIAKIAMRKGEKDALALLLEVKRISFETMELQRVIPSMVALLEYEWLTEKAIIEQDEIEKTAALMQKSGIDSEKAEFGFWMKKAGRYHTSNKEMAKSYDTSSLEKAVKAAAFWEKAGCPYEYALLLFEGKEDDKRKALAIVQDLGANMVFEKLKGEMKNLGIKNIPRGLRASTRSNAAFLTGREIEILHLLKEELHNKEIAARLYISPKTVDHHISSILFKLDVGSRSKAVNEAVRMGILK